MQLGFIGLGKMGSRMVEKLLSDNHEVIVWNRTQERVANFQFEISQKNLEKHLKIALTLENLVLGLKTPRVIWSMLPAGFPTEEVSTELSKLLEKDDILIDGGNSYFKDTQKRYIEFRKKGIRFLGIGVSGGLIAAKNGYPLMVGGDKSAYEHIEDILESLVAPNGEYDYFGEGGAGHFVKMVHNGIEYGYMQSLGEGFGVLEKSPYDLDLAKVGKLWQNGSLVSGFMLDRAVEVLEKDQKLIGVVGYIEESGEAKWTVEQAKQAKVPIDVIEKSLDFRRKSQNDKLIQKSFAARLIAALRQAFGGHDDKKK